MARVDSHTEDIITTTMVGSIMAGGLTTIVAVTTTTVWVTMIGQAAVAGCMVARETMEAELLAVGMLLVPKAPRRPLGTEALALTLREPVTQARGLVVLVITTATPAITVGATWMVATREVGTTGAANTDLAVAATFTTAQVAKCCHLTSYAIAAKHQVTTSVTVLRMATHFTILVSARVSQRRSCGRV